MNEDDRLVEYFAAEEFLKRIRTSVLDHWPDAYDAGRAQRIDYRSSTLDFSMRDGSRFEVTVRTVAAAPVGSPE